MKKNIFNILFFLFCAVILTFSLRGLPGNPTPLELNTPAWKEMGPLELSPERGRFALAYSIAEDKSFSFSDGLAHFVAPDLGYSNGSYVSLFAPSVSFLIIPGYQIGKLLGISQVGSFAVIALFAIFNVFLLRSIAIRLRAHPLAATIASIAFLFASPAFSYAVTLYQHHVSTFLILAAIYLLIRYNSALSLAGIWMLCAFSITVDYPNLFMMLPIGILGIMRTLPFKYKFGKVVMKIPFMRILAVFAVLVPLLFFFWFNKVSYGNPLQLSGTAERVVAFEPNGSPIFERDVELKRLKEKNLKVPENMEKTAVGFFNSRNMINGFHTHFISPDRGILMYAPVMLFGVIGFILAIRRRMKYLGLLTGVMGFNILLYSMWGDPYGGWAFGSRYLIPTYAILSIFIAFALTRFRQSVLFLMLFFVIFTYSVAVNTSGALTTGANPPKVEAVELERVSKVTQKYTYMRNMDFLHANVSKSFIFQSLAKSYVSAWNYYLVIAVGIVSFGAFLILALNSVGVKTVREEKL